MKKTVRISHEEMAEAALSTGHAFQATRIKQMIDKGWRAYGVSTREGVSVVAMSQPASGLFGVVYPNGLFVRNLPGRKTVSWSWSKAQDYAHATVPAIGVAAA